MRAERSGAARALPATAGTPGAELLAEVAV